MGLSGWKKTGQASSALFRIQDRYFRKLLLQRLCAGIFTYPGYRIGFLVCLLMNALELAPVLQYSWRNAQGGCFLDGKLRQRIIPGMMAHWMAWPAKIIIPCKTDSFITYPGNKLVNTNSWVHRISLHSF